MKVEMIEIIDNQKAHSIGRSDILEVKQEHVEQYKSFYKSYSELNLENMIQDNSFIKIMKLKLKSQVLKLTERIKIYSNKLYVSRQYDFSDPERIDELSTADIHIRVDEDKIKSFNNIIKSVELDKDTNAFWRSKIKELTKERQLLKNYSKILSIFHSHLKKSIYDLEKDIFMKQEEVK